jgi:hypothetical protein
MGDTTTVSERLVASVNRHRRRRRASAAGPAPPPARVNASAHSAAFLHGLEELGAKLQAISVAGRWNEMPAEIPRSPTKSCGSSPPATPHDRIAAASRRATAGSPTPSSSFSRPALPPGCSASSWPTFAAPRTASKAPYPLVRARLELNAVLSKTCRQKERELLQSPDSFGRGVIPVRRPLHPRSAEFQPPAALSIFR